MPELFATADLCDAHPDLLDSGALRVMGPIAVSLGKRPSFCGRASTLRVFEDNSLVAERVKSPGAGRVLVVDGEGSRRCALLGGNLARAAQDHGWTGIIIAGAVRDAEEIEGLSIGVRALCLHPRRSLKRGQGEADVPVTVFGVRVMRGDWVYADRDGVLVSDRDLFA
jgi:regulator of ribonuclease activity A